MLVAISLKGFGDKTKREFRIRLFGERNRDGMMINELDHVSYRLIIIKGVQGEELCGVANDWFSG